MGVFKSSQRRGRVRAITIRESYEVPQRRRQTNSIHFLVEVKVAQPCTTLCNPMDTGHGILQAGILEWVAFPFSRGSSQPPGTEPRPPILQADSLPAEPPGKPKNTGVESLLLLQWIFPTQELNQSLLHCRWIVYQLLYYLIRCPNVHCSTVYNSQDMETT